MFYKRKNIRDRFLVILTGLLLCLTGIASESRGVQWQYFTEDGNGNPVYYDPGSLEAPAFDVVRVWIKYRTPYRNLKDYGFSVTRIKIDCFRDKLTSEAIVDFDSGGGLMSSVSSPGQPWFSIPPDTFYAKLQGTVCPVWIP